MSNSNVTASDTTIDLADLARVTGGQAPAACRDGGCIPGPFPRPFPGGPRPFPFPRPNPFPGPRNPFEPILGAGGGA